MKHVLTYQYCGSLKSRPGHAFSTGNCTGSHHNKPHLDRSWSNASKGSTNPPKKSLRINSPQSNPRTEILRNTMTTPKPHRREPWQHTETLSRQWNPCNTLKSSQNAETLAIHLNPHRMKHTATHNPHAIKQRAAHWNPHAHSHHRSPKNVRKTNIRTSPHPTKPSQSQNPH